MPSVPAGKHPVPETPKATLTQANAVGATETDASADETPLYGPQDRVTVLFGWGKVAPEQTSYASAGGSDATTDKTVIYKSVGGCFRNVQYRHAVQWQKIWVDEAGVSRVLILPADADDMDMAKAAGIRPMDPMKLAAQIAASDPADLVKVLGPRKLAELAEVLLAGLGTKK